MFREDWIEQRKQDPVPKRSHPKPKEGTETIFNRSQKGAREKQREAVRLVKKQKRKEQRQKSAGTAPVAAAHFPPNEMTVFVSCLPGLEPILAAEMERLGFHCSIEAGGVTPKDNIGKDDLLKLHLHLGSASHVLIRCGTPFIARGLPELRRKVAQLPWHVFLSDRGQVSPDPSMIQLQVRVTTKKSKLNHKTAVRTAVVDGINEAFQTVAADRRRSVSHLLEATEESIALPLNVRIEHDEVMLSVDSSTTPLHRRGYRLATAKAPLREDLAFAMLYSAGWSAKHADSDHSQSTPVPLPFTGFLDPFCGSGTIAIEAASMALGLPPGRLRPAPLAGTVLHHPRDWQQVVAEQTQKDPHTKLSQIAASDRDEGAIAAAKSNAERAGVLDSIQFQCSAIGAHPWLNLKSDKESAYKDYSTATTVSSTIEEPTGPYPLLVATNPPFGLRIAASPRQKEKGQHPSHHPLLPLYQTLVGRQDKLSTAGSSVTTMTLLHDLNLFRRTGAQNVDVQWSSQHGGISVAAVLTPAPAKDETLIEEENDNEIAS